MIEIINELPENVVGNFFGHLVPGKYKGFQDSEIETAKTWVAEP